METATTGSPVYDHISWSSTSFTYHASYFNSAVYHTATFFGADTCAMPVRDWEGPQDREHLRTRIAMGAAARRLARRRARRTLLDWLSPDQVREYRKRRVVTAEAPSGRVYELETARYGNIYEMREGRRVRCLCAHPDAPVPNEDTVLALKMMLEAGMEDDVLDVANVHWGAA